VEAKADKARNFWSYDQSDPGFGCNCWGSSGFRSTPRFFGRGPIWILFMSTQPSDFSGFMIIILLLSFVTISYFMGMMVHSAFMHEDKNKIGKDSRNGWILSMVAGTGITGWMFYYGYYANFLR
jgi:hypothetical protein